ncbi:MAG TPA: 2-oxoacid:ferredoxin oxidoreductase subunit beta [Candidatus Krumholzibacteria bacterium]|nr:2-oxoacid:ferredoxin oxidoreductase subunit beta [Candidatus Krumholzibacteria bacterium]
MTLDDNGQDTAAGTATVQLTRKDMESDQEVRWCPGCGDYAILKSFQQVFAKLGIPREQFVVVSGIGCSSRLPYYVNTYGFHTIHGRAPAIATGVKVANPELSVWIGTGDGDGLSIGGNHLIHVLRRNVDVKIVLFNNRIYGLTKGQYSPTSEQGKKTKSTPFGSVEQPFNPLSVAIGAEATFVARTVDVYGQHLMRILEAAAAHRGAAFVEVYQNCNIFNDGAFDFMRGKEVRDENTLELEHGKPILFGSKLEKGLRLRGAGVEVVQVADVGIDQILVHDAEADDPTLAFLLSRLGPPDLPTPIGILRSVQHPIFDRDVHEQVNEVTARKGVGDLDALIHSGDTWTV